MCAGAPPGSTPFWSRQPPKKVVTDTGEHGPPAPVTLFSQTLSDLGGLLVGIALFFFVGVVQLIRVVQLI